MATIQQQVESGTIRWPLLLLLLLLPRIGLRWQQQHSSFTWRPVAGDVVVRLSGRLASSPIGVAPCGDAIDALYGALCRCRSARLQAKNKWQLQMAARNEAACKSGRPEPRTRIRKLSNHTCWLLDLPAPPLPFKCAR